MSDVYTFSVMLSLATFVFSTYVTPGPTNIIMLSSVLNFGYRKNIPFMLANIVSYPIMMLVVGLGLGLFLTQYDTAMSVLKVAGVSYICFMAYKIAKDSTVYDSDAKETKPFGFWQGFVYPWLNPKAWIVNTSMISIFVTSAEKSSQQIGVIVFFVLLATILSVFLWSFGGLMLKRFMTSKLFIQRLNRAMAFLLVASVVPIVF